MDQFEPPKYIEKLIASVNDGAKSAQLGALAFVALGLVLLATAFSATDEDLLLNRSITVSQLGGAQVPVVLTFGIAPAVFLALHLYTLMRYDMLAANIRRFRDDLAVMVKVEADRERCRQLLANVEFVQALLAPKGTPGASFVFRWAVWVVLAVFPVFVLLLVQLSSLRLQNEVVNWVHHAAILLDLALLGWFAWRLPGRTGWPWRNGQPVRVRMVPVLAALAVAGADLAWMRVPGAEERTVRGEWPVKVSVLGVMELDHRPVIQPPLPFVRFLFLRTDLAPIDRGPLVILEGGRYLGRMALFIGKMAQVVLTQPVDLILCAEAGFGCRFLTVTDRTIVANVWDARGLVEMRAGGPVDEWRKAAADVAVLSGRRLRFIKLIGSKLFAANLRGADLQGADLSEANLNGADLHRALLQGAHFSNAMLQGANLSHALLQGARLVGASLQGADLSGARLEGAILFRAKLQGANLSRAQLQGADLSYGFLQAANLSYASFQGAVLYGAGMWNVRALPLISVRDSDLPASDTINTVHPYFSPKALTSAESLVVALSAGSDGGGMSPQPDMSLADLREVRFTPIPAQERQILMSVLPEPIRNYLRDVLTPRPGADALPSARTTLGPALVSDPSGPEWRHLTPRQITDDPERIAPALASFLARQVAPISANSTRRVLDRVPVLSSSCDPLADALIVPLRDELMRRDGSSAIGLSPSVAWRLSGLTPSCFLGIRHIASTPARAESYFDQLWQWLWGPATPSSAP